jgi:hypothetical protein
MASSSHHSRAGGSSPKTEDPPHTAILTATPVVRNVKLIVLQAVIYYLPIV